MRHEFIFSVVVDLHLHAQEIISKKVKAATAKIHEKIGASTAKMYGKIGAATQNNKQQNPSRNSKNTPKY